LEKPRGSLGQKRKSPRNVRKRSDPLVEEGDAGVQGRGEEVVRKRGRRCSLAPDETNLDGKKTGNPATGRSMPEKGQVPVHELEGTKLKGEEKKVLGVQGFEKKTRIGRHDRPNLTTTSAGIFGGDKQCES